MKLIKSKLFFVFLVLLTIGITVSASNISELDLFKKEIHKIGSEVRNINKNARSKDISEKVILEIGDEKIALEQFETVGAGLKTKDKNKIADFIIRGTLLNKIAQDNGIIVSDSDIKNYMQELKSFIENNANAKERFDIYLESFGFTEKEFWNNEKTFDQYRSALLQGKYRSYLRKYFTNKYKNKTLNEINELVNKRIETLIEIEKKNIKIKKHF
ncbi:SurA N-terminal domain-containing protein [Clostridiisalibacter paucivorans]|uniref:SurA N-terminal domain-containing protein n=1 Tax=Clostridiisalibacter paucivorans TaxID=408753 RepID=UPI00047B4526|nr:SurA N-terminal domain-containing protein [Clostridiisalibacter paucivorans]